MPESKNAGVGVGVVGALALAGVSMLAVTVEGCIVADDISFPEDGYRWCAELEFAEEWDDPQNKVSIQDGNNDWPYDCHCFDADENQIMLDAPTMGQPNYAEYLVLLDDVRDLARDKCLSLRSDDPTYDFDNCQALAAVASVFAEDSMGESDCENWVEHSSGTGYDTDAGDHITCMSRDCEIDEAFWDEIEGNPFLLAKDSTYGRAESGGWKLYSVSSGSVAYELGLRTGDVVTDIDTIRVQTRDDLDTAILSLRDETDWTVKVTRGASSYTFIYEIV